MSAIVKSISAAAEKRDAARYIETLRNMRLSMHSIGIELDRVEKLDHSKRAIALAIIQQRYASLNFSADSLRRESLEAIEASAPDDAEPETVR